MRSQFLMSFPAFAILDRERNDFHYIAKPGEATATIVLHTDDDLLARYLAEQRLNGVGVPISSAPALALFLDKLPRHITRIAIDPGDQSVFTGSIEDFMRRVIENLPGDSNN